MTVDVQPDPERHLLQGWIYGFADGTGGYPLEWTALKSSNWHAFLDPNEEWEQTIYRNNANVVRQIGQNLANAKAARAFDGWNRGWIKTVERHVGAWAHVEHGIGMHVYLPAQRDAPTNMINNALSVASAHKLRFGQDLILYNLELTDAVEGFDGQAHKDAWINDPIWQGVRENVERLTGDPRLGRGVLRRRGRVRAAGGRAVPLGVHHAGGGSPGRLRHPDADGRRRVRHRPRRCASPAACSAMLVRRRGARRGQPGDDAGLAGGVDAASASPPAARCSRSGRSRARRSIRFEESLEHARGASRRSSPISTSTQRSSTR